MGFRSQAENARPCNIWTGRVGDRIGSSRGLAEAGEGKYVGVLAVLAAATIWGTLGLFLKGLYAQGVAFEALVAVRAAGGCAAMACFLLLTRRAGRLRVKAANLALLIPLGVVPVGVFYLLYFYTIRESTVGTSAILLYSSPAFVVLLAWAFLGERPTSARLLALLLTLAGVALAVGAHEPGTLAVRPLVLLAGLGAGLSYELYTIIGKPLAGRLSPAVMLTYALALGTLVVLPVAAPTLDTLTGLSPVGYVLLAAVVVVHTALAFALYTAGLKRLEAGQAAVLAALEPVVAVVAGGLLLGEELGPSTVIGGALVVSGAVLAQARSTTQGRRGRRPSRRPETSLCPSKRAESAKITSSPTSTSC